MAYHTNLYLLIFLPAVVVGYQISPQRHRWKVLLFGSYLYFFLVSRMLVLYQIGTVFLTYFTGLGLVKQENNKKRHKLLLLLGLAGIFLPLLFLKYYNFISFNISSLLGTDGSFEAKNLLLPIGISFYTLEAAGYLADVYWKKIQPERNPGKLALFLSFFPQIMEGPISRYEDVVPTLYAGKEITGDHVVGGAQRILWGLFKKMVVADRLSILVTGVFDHFADYSGMMVVIAAVAYTIQLYMEFSGVIDIVIGSGKIFGIFLPENFRQPFFAKNASDFWRRWHITLGVWFKNYVFYPVSLSGIVKKWNRYSRKHFGKYISKIGMTAMALFPVWLCNGIWHGPKWNYIFYGMYYFGIILLGTMIEPVRNKFLKVTGICEMAWYWRALQIGKTWLIIFTGELFFRADGVKAGIHMFFSIFQDFWTVRPTKEEFLHIGFGVEECIAVLLGVMVVAVVEILQERYGNLEIRILQLKRPLRWGLYYLLIFSLVILGAYGSGYQQVDLIYAGF